MNEKVINESKVVTFIGGFYILGGCVVLLSLIFGGSSLNMVFDLKNIPDIFVKLGIAILFIPIGFLYVKRKRIGYWFILIFSAIFFCLSASQVAEWNQQPYIGNIIYSIFVIIVTIVRRKEFWREQEHI